MQRMGRIEAKFDALVWVDLCEACQLLGLTPAELVASLLEVCRDIKAGAHPLQAFIDAEVQRRLEAMTPTGPEPDEVDDVQLDALEQDVRRLIDAVKSRVTPGLPGAAPE